MMPISLPAKLSKNDSTGNRLQAAEAWEGVGAETAHVQRLLSIVFSGDAHLRPMLGA